MANVCTDCGAPIYATWNVCAECGAPVLNNKKISNGIPGGSKVRRIKISALITMILGALIGVAQVGMSFSYQKFNLSEQNLWNAIDMGTISWEVFEERMSELNDQYLLEMLIFSNMTLIAGIALQFAIIALIIGFLSISFDTVFKEKTRRIYFIATCAFILFYFYMILSLIGV